MTAPTPPVRAATTFTDAQRSMLRTMLEEQRNFRIEQIRQPLPARGRAQTEADREVASAILQAAQIALRDIDAALARMDNGTYGKCVRCGHRMRVERLEVLPQVALCMDCQRRTAH